MPTIQELPPADLEYLANDPGFSEFISNDPELDNLDAEKYSPAMELRMIGELSGSTYAIGTACLFPLSPLHLAYFWVLDNPFITHRRPKTQLDADIFLYILSSRTFSGSPQQLVVSAAGFCRDHGIMFEQACEEIREMLSVSFNPLTFHPKNPGNNTAPVYDADWIAMITTSAAESARVSAIELMNYPLSAVLWYHTQTRRKLTNDSNSIRRRTPD